LVNFEPKKNGKPKPDIFLAIIICVFVFSIILSITLSLLKIMKLWLAIGIPSILLVTTVLYLILKNMNNFSRQEQPKDDLLQIITPKEAWMFAKNYFQNEFGIRMIINHQKSYLLLKTVGQENYETKIYSIFAKEEAVENYFHIVLKGHEPDGCVFLKNETNIQKIREMEEGLATKSKLIKTEVITHENVLTGQKITKKVESPVRDEDEEEPEEEAQQQNDEQNAFSK